jgi:GNAT superfamily N-acetyltransferase
LKLSFRFAEEADILALLDLQLAVDAEQARRFGSDRWRTTINEKSVARGLKTSRILLACEPGRIVAAMRIDTKKPWAVDLEHFTPVGKAVYLHDVNVAPEVQRSGIGRELLDRVERAVREWSVDAIRVDTYDGSAGAGQFYARCGFNEVGRAVYRRVPLVYFELVF